MRHIQIPALQGRVLKVHVGGPSGFRLAYFVHVIPPSPPSDDETVLACPFFLSNEPRSRFDWDDFDWQGACQTVYDALMAGDDTAFIRWAA